MNNPSVGAAAGQRDLWESVLSETPDMFGLEPSRSGKAAAARFSEVDALSLLELGAGQGRDTLYFVDQGFDVTAADFSESGLDSIRVRAAHHGGFVRCVTHDVRKPLPFPDGSIDGCYSHMLFCMALTTVEIESLMAEIRRVLRPGGLVAYTVRTTRDAGYGDGRDWGDDMFEHEGFVVHFFGPELIDRLSDQFEIIDRFEFTEGALPRRLISVTMRKR